MPTGSLITASSLTPYSESGDACGDENNTPSTTIISPQPGQTGPRSCYDCNRRKVRCDKKEPCSACARARKPCTYPPHGPRLRRTKMTIMADMATRIRSLEDSLTQAREANTSASAVNEPSSNNADKPLLAQPLLALPPQYSGEDILVQKGSSSQYFNEAIFSRVIEEEQSIESVFTSPQPGSPQPWIPSPFNALGILSSPSSSIIPSSFHPSAQVAEKLWKNYVENVDGYAALKLLHLPTDEVRVYSTIKSPGTASLENLALCFAIYFASTVSIDALDTKASFGADKTSILLGFKSGLEQSLAHGDFLDSPTVAGIHALAIYLAALGVQNRKKGIWVLNGLAIRIAQSLGLHRDGKRLGLSPFQCEIRRRLWWHIISRDSRSGEEYGLEPANSRLLDSDVDMPANIHDTDMYPEMEHPPKPRQDWTPMTFSLIRIELAKIKQKIATVVSSSSPTCPPSENVRLQLIRDTEAHVEKWLLRCNPVLPQQRLALYCSRFLVRKLKFVSKLQWIVLRRDGTQAEFTTEEHLAEALEILDPTKYEDLSLIKQSTWVSRAYPQVHVSMYVLWHLCVLPEGPNVDRAWEVIQTMFCRGLCDGSTIGAGSMGAVLIALKAKATSVRERLQTSAAGICRNSSAEGEREGTPRGEAPSSDGYGFVDIDEGWPNWTTMVQGFELDSPGLFWQ